MDEVPSKTQMTETAGPETSWLFACFIATTAVSLAAAHAPPRIRLIGLFSIAFGLLIGWILVRLAVILEAEPSARLLGPMAICFTIGGLIGSTCEVVRLDTLKRKDSQTNKIAQQLIESMKTQSNLMGATPSDANFFTEFRKHLSYRIYQLGTWSSPWPEIFWLSEIALGSIASAWISRHRRLKISQVQC